MYLSMYLSIGIDTEAKPQYIAGIYIYIYIYVTLKLSMCLSMCLSISLFIGLGQNNTSIIQIAVVSKNKKLQYNDGNN
jgi:hypothetical protein